MAYVGLELHNKMKAHLSAIVTFLALSSSNVGLFGLLLASQGIRGNKLLGHVVVRRTAPTTQFVDEMFDRNGNDKKCQCIGNPSRHLLCTNHTASASSGMASSFFG